MDGRRRLRMAQAPSSASAADDATNLRMEQMMLIAPLSLMGCPSRGRLPMKKYPDALLFESFALRYDASEWTLSIMSEA
eukprot:scaffold52397_cov88-Cyclotella_meneghiniana.AAC.1